jgi:hypothetical protein
VIIFWIVTTCGAMKIDAVCSSETLVCSPVDPLCVTTQKIYVDTYSAVKKVRSYMDVGHLLTIVETRTPRLRSNEHVNSH